MESKRRVKLAAALIAVGVFCLLAEAVSFVALKYVPIIRHNTYTPPEFSREEFDSYMKTRNPILGWPSSDWIKTFADENGARNSPANQELNSDRPCVSIYGDSFAFAQEVSDEDAWGNVMARNMACRVDNYGIGGFGTDQAYLRFLDHVESGHPVAPKVVLTIYPDNLNRNMNQWRYLRGSHPFAFKPAYFSGKNGVELDPIFSGDYEDAMALTLDPGAYLRAETYAPNAPGFSRPVAQSFPYSLTLSSVLIDLAKTYRGGAPEGYSFLSNYPGYFDNRSGMSQDKQVVAKFIFSEFDATCEMYGLECYVLHIPDAEMIHQILSTGSNDVDVLLQSIGLSATVISATDMFDSLSSICASLSRPSECGGHFSVDGYDQLAKFVEAKLN